PTPTYSNNTNAGTATASYTYAGDTNHTSSSDSKNFTIGQASSTTTVTCPAGPFTYNGSAQTPCSATVTGAGGLSLTPTPTSSNNTNAGTATATYTSAGHTNHTSSSDSKNFTIGKRDVSAKISASGKVYDGSTDAAYSCAVQGKVASDAVICDGVHPAHFGSKDVGTRTATASGLALSGTDAGDYHLTNSSDTGQAAITARSITVKATDK